MTKNGTSRGSGARHTWFAAVSILAGCGGSGGDGGDGPTGTPPADLTGTYAVEHTFNLVGAGPITEDPCAGTLEIETQSGNSFSGTVTVDAVGDCVGFGGVVGGVSGSVAGNQITFTVSGIEDPLAALGCEITGGAESFMGTVTTTRIEASRRIEGECTLGDETIPATVVWEIDGTKTS